MTRRKFLVESLCHYAATNIAVVVGVCIGTAVLTGALLVGDSMRGTLRAMTLQRLGDIEYAIVGPNFFSADLADRVRANEQDSLEAASAILIKAALTGPEQRRAASVQIVGTTPQFWQLFPEPDPAHFDQVVINETLARELGLDNGSQMPARIVLHIQEETDVPRDAPLGRRDVVPKSVPLMVQKIIPDTGVGRFSLELSQKIPPTLFLPIRTLAEEIRQAGRANALFIAQNQSVEQNSLARRVENAVTLDDLGVEMVPSRTWISVESRENILSDPVLEKVLSIARENNWATQTVLSYLANTIAANDREVPYSIATALEVSPQPPFGPLTDSTGPTSLEPGEILLNQWAAERLAANVGDQVRLDYYTVRTDGSLQDASHTFRLAGILPMTGLAIDRGYVLEFKGITDADTIGEWDAPFEIDLDRIKKEDETYWDTYRTAPKAFLRLDDGQRIWSTRFGDATSIRIAIPQSMDAAAFQAEVADKLRSNLEASKLGLVLNPVRELDLRASSGSTDFGMLFLAMSFFLIVSAALLVGLLFRLNTELRASSIGVLLAIGWTPATVRRMLIAEGAILATIGALLGLPAAALYASWILRLLSTRWADAVGTSFVDFHWTWTSLAIGAGCSIVVAVLAIVWATRRVARVPVPSLIADGYPFASTARTGRNRVSIIVAIFGVLAGATLLLMGWLGVMPQVAAFFAAATAWLAGATALFAVYLNKPTSSNPSELVQGRDYSAVARLGVRNSQRYPARSLATVTLLALAVFLVVAVGAMRHDLPAASPQKSSGNGGFSLLMTTATPLTRDLNTADGRFAMNISGQGEKLLERALVFGFRVRPGDDASCLNVYQPTDPTVLAASKSFRDRGGFAFASAQTSSKEQAENPWILLEQNLGEGVIPAIGDAATLQWILKVPVGRDLEIKDESGQTVKLRIVAALAQSIFQGQLLISEENFLQLFPTVSGKALFAIETPVENAPDVAQVLQEDLSDFGADVKSTRDVLAGYLAVQATYMAAFETLGGLGLLLGTLGLAAVLLRNVFERRAELALLSALGFRRGKIALVILAESLFLLLAGIGIGLACALIAASQPLSQLADWSAIAPLAATLAGVLLLGLASGLFATLVALRFPILPSLRAERV